MPYASGRVIHDADAHIMEVPGFLAEHLEAKHRAAVTDTSKPLGRLHAHRVRIEAGAVAVGDTVELKVDAERRDRTRPADAPRERFTLGVYVFTTPQEGERPGEPR